jgi:diacylglycerol kinase (ATP)
MPSVSIFANPISGRGRGRKIATRLAEFLQTAGYDVNVFLERADKLSHPQVDPESAAAIVIGGDGTVRTVAGRLYIPDEQRPDRTAEGPPLLVVPMGTANLMGKHLGIKWDDEHVGQQVLDTLRTGHVVKLDTASANGDLLLLVAGVGLDGRIVHELTQRRTGPISYLSYALPTITALQAYDYPSLTVHIDGEKVFGPAPAMAFIGNIREYGTGFPILPLANPTDGLLDVCVLPCASPEELMQHVIRVAAGEHIHGEGVVYKLGKVIEVESLTPAAVQVDGEAAGHTPLVIDLLPVQLPFMVPG